MEIGTIISLPEVDQGPRLPGIKPIPAGTFKIVNIYKCPFSKTGKVDHDTTVSVVKINRSGGPIGKRTYEASLSFFKENSL